MSNYRIGLHKEHSCEIISKSTHWLRRISRLQNFLLLVWWPSSSTERKGEAISVESYLRNATVKLFQKSVHRFSKRNPLKLFFLFVTLAAILFNETKQFKPFWYGSPKDHSCLIILKSMQWLRKRICLKVFFSIFISAAILFNAGERFGQF